MDRDSAFLSVPGLMLISAAAKSLPEAHGPQCEAQRAPGGT